MLLRDILQYKGDAVRRIGPDATLDDVVAELVRHGIGSLLVSGADGAILGIVTERDVLRAHATHRRPLEQILVNETMTTELITATPEDGIEVAMRLMTYHRIRHLPILDDRRLYGIISIGDIVKSQHDVLAAENHFLRSYISGEGAELTTPAE